jgi:hypothetical protein
MPHFQYRHSKDNWEPDFLKRWPDVSTETTEKYFHNLYAAQPDFLYSVSRDFIRNCRTPMLVLPDDVPGHPKATSAFAMRRRALGFRSWSPRAAV